MIDIIIPAWNCTNTLPRTLASIAAQTKKEKCIVTVVDDCSTEDLKPIIDNFKQYIKINYIKLSENLKYPGLVREVGLDNSIAPFVMFLDSDDILAPTAIEILHEAMLKNPVDVIIGYFYMQDEKNNFILMKEDCTTWLHGNAYRRKFLEENNIHFPWGYNEDGAFNTQCFMMTDKIGILEKPVMYWMHNKNSITRTEKYFSHKYADHIITTLNFAYQNIFRYTEKNKKVLENMGTHWTLFYKIYEELYSFFDEEYEETRVLLCDALQDFLKDLHINDFTEQEKVYFKNGFVKGLKKYYPINRPVMITIEDFLEKYNLDISLKITDFLRGE